MAVRKSGLVSMADLNIEAGVAKETQLSLDDARALFMPNRNASSTQAAQDGLGVNAAIPTSGEISFENFYGAVREFEFTSEQSLVEGSTTLVDLTGSGFTKPSATTLVVKSYLDGDYVTADFLVYTDNHGSPSKTAKYRFDCGGHAPLRHVTLTPISGSPTVISNQRPSVLNTSENPDYFVMNSQSVHYNPTEDYNQIQVNVNIVRENYRVYEQEFTFVVRFDKAGLNGDVETGLNSDLTDNLPSPTTELAKAWVLPAIDLHYGTNGNHTFQYRFRVQSSDNSLYLYVNNAWRRVATPSTYETIHVLWNAASGNASWNWNATDDWNQEEQHRIYEDDEFTVTVEANQAGSVQLNVVFLFTVDSTNQVYEQVSFDFRPTVQVIPAAVAYPTLSDNSDVTVSATTTTFGADLTRYVEVLILGGNLVARTSDAQTQVLINNVTQSECLVSIETDADPLTVGSASISGKADTSVHNMIPLSGLTLPYRCNLTAGPSEHVETNVSIFYATTLFPSDVDKFNAKFDLENQSQKQMSYTQGALSGFFDYASSVYSTKETVPSDGSVNVVLERVMSFNISVKRGYMHFTSSGGDAGVLDIRDMELTLALQSSSGLSVSGLSTTPVTLTDGFECEFTMSRTLFDEFNQIAEDVNEVGSFSVVLAQAVSGATVTFNFEMGFDYSDVTSKVSKFQNPNMTLFSPACTQSEEEGDQALAGVGLHKEADGTIWIVAMNGGPTFNFTAERFARLSTGGNGLEWRVIPVSGTLEKLSGAAWNTWYEANGSNDDGSYVVPNYVDGLDTSGVGTLINGVFNPTITGIFGFGLIAPKTTDDDSYYFEQVKYFYKNPFVSCVLQVRDAFSKKLYMNRTIVLQYQLS